MGACSAREHACVPTVRRRILAEAVSFRRSTHVIRRSVPLRPFVLVGLAIAFVLPGEALLGAVQRPLGSTAARGETVTPAFRGIGDLDRAESHLKRGQSDQVALVLTDPLRAELQSPESPLRR